MVFAQAIPKKYNDLIKQVDFLLQAKAYTKAPSTYSQAFKVNAWKGFPNDRYNAACAWSLADIPDSAFFQLNRIATKSNYADYKHITMDQDLHSLHSDKRWDLLLENNPTKQRQGRSKL
jgi:hypothetical protein